MVDVKTYECFPTLINEFKFEQSLDEQKEMIDFVKYFDDKDEYKRDILHKDKLFHNLSNYILMLCGELLSKYDYEYDSLEYTSMWANILGLASIHAPHTHSNNLLSGVFFLQASDFSSPIQFFDPRVQSSILVPRRKKNNIYNSNVVQFNAICGTGFIFPAWLQHWVPQQKRSGDIERISLSWNVIARGEYGEPNALQNAYI